MSIRKSQLSSLFGLACIAVAPVQAEDYQFDIVTDPDGDFSLNFQAGAINNHGDVIFAADRNGSLSDGVFVASRASGYTSLAILAEETPDGAYGDVTRGWGVMDINDSGDAVFYAAPSGGTFALYTGSNPATDFVGGGTGSIPAINNLGDIVYNGTAGASNRIFTQTSSGSSFLVSGSGSLSAPRLNNHGQVVTVRDTGSDTQVLLLNITQTNSAAVIADGLGANSDFFPNSIVSDDILDINDDGSVVFVAESIFDGLGIYEWNDGVITTRVTVSDGFSDFDDLRITAAGDIVFEAETVGGGRGIFVDNGSTIETVIAGGDPLFGDTMEDLPSFFPLLLDVNDSGSVFFQYDLVDSGKRGLAVASLSAIPEPASLSLLALGGLTMVGRRRRVVR